MYFDMGTKKHRGIMKTITAAFQHRIIEKEQRKKLAAILEKIEGDVLFEQLGFLPFRGNYLIAQLILID